jgi:hypothetical protein
MLEKNKDARICIVGAGAGGLSIAYFLKKQGYRNVTVLEKSGRVGGLCCSITFDSRSFDLGANFLTPAYKEVLKMAEEVGAKLYSEEPGVAFDPSQSTPDNPKYYTILSAVTKGTTLVQFLLAVIRFFWERFKLDSIISTPGFKGISKHPELTQPFLKWLESKDIVCLKALFEIPITAMGYGYLDEIPTVYALKYMTIKTFWTLVTYGADIDLGWPKRFIDGFQRLWERISWGINVKFNITIKEIKRGEKISVKFTDQEQLINESDPRERTEEFDYLVLACGLTRDVLNHFLDLSEEEKALFDKIVLNPYCLTSYVIEDLTLPNRVINVVPLDQMANPWFIAQQFEDNQLIAFYSRTDIVEETKVKEKVLAGIQAAVEKLGGRIENPEDYYTFDLWPYFPHVSSQDMQEGFYDRLEELQGKQNTYYVGGLMNFELVETIVEYSKALVEKNFPLIRSK